MRQSTHGTPNTPTKDDILGKTRRGHPNIPINPASGVNNVELTYYTLSGKEVNIREEIQRPISVNTGYIR